MRGLRAVVLVGAGIQVGMAQAPFKSPQALEAWMVTYHRRPEPGRLGMALRAAVKEGLLPRPQVLGFFVAAYRKDPQALQLLESGLAQEELTGQMGGFLVLKSLGVDVSDQMYLLPDEYRGQLGKVDLLTDPRELLAPAGARPETDAVQRAGDRLGHAWGAYRATGDPTYLRTLMVPLAWAGEHPAFLAWIRQEKRDAKPEAVVARGYLYTQAGACLLKLNAEDAEAARTLRAWAEGPQEPESLRRELKGLATNPAFGGR